MSKKYTTFMEFNLRRSFAAVGLFFCLAGPGEAEGVQGFITLSEFTTTLVAKHPFLRAEALSGNVEEARAEAIDRNENWVLNVNPSYRYEEPVSTSLFAAEEVTSFGASAALSRKIWASGGALRLGYEGASVDQTVQPILFPGSQESGFESVLPEFYSHKAFLAYSQPLLKNRGGKQDRLPADLQAFRVTQAHLQALENAEDYILSKSKEFLDWVLLSELTSIAEQRESLALSQWEETKKERDANYVDEVDLIRSESNYIQAQQRSLDVKSRTDALGLKLAVILGDESILKKIPRVAHWASLDLAAFADNEVSSRIVDIMNLTEESLSRELERFENSKQADLSLELMGGVGSGDARFSDSQSFDQPLAQVGLVFRHPLGAHPDDAQADRIQLEIRQAELRQAHATRRLEAARKGLRLRMRELSRVVGLNTKQLAVSVRKTQAEEGMYRQGRSSLNFVMQSRDEEAMVKSQLIENTIEYQKLSVEYDALNDQLFVGF